MPSSQRLQHRLDEPERSRATARRRSASARSAAGRWRPSSTARATRSASRTYRSTRRSAASAAARRRARCWPACCSRGQPCCCSTSRPTTSTSTASRGWRTSSAGSTARAGGLPRPPIPRRDGVAGVGARAAACWRPTRAATRRIARRRPAGGRGRELAYKAQEKRRKRLEADISATRGYAQRRRAPRAGQGRRSSSATPRRWRRRRESRERRLQRELGLRGAHRQAARRRAR